MILTFNKILTNSLKSVNKQINHGLKDLANWLKATKILLWFVFTSSNKQLENDLKLKLNEKRPAEENSVKYLENQIDKNLAWKKQVNYVAIKLYESNIRISKLKHILDEKNSE